MAYPGKGPRVGVTIKCHEDERRRMKTLAADAGLTLTDYLIEAALRVELDAHGRAVWADRVDRGGQLELSA